MAVDDGACGVGIMDINPEATEAALGPARAQGLPAASAVCDIQVGPQCHAAFDAVAAKLGRIDTLVNCAAIYPRRPILEITDAEWDASNGINVKGTYHMMAAAIRHMQAQRPKGEVRGRIVNLTSVDAFKAHPQNAHYAATKAAVVSLTRSVALVAPLGRDVLAGMRPEDIPGFYLVVPHGRLRVKAVAALHRRLIQQDWRGDLEPPLPATTPLSE